MVWEYHPALGHPLVGFLSHRHPREWIMAWGANKMPPFHCLTCSGRAHRFEKRVCSSCWPWGVWGLGIGVITYGCWRANWLWKTSGRFPWFRVTAWSSLPSRWWSGCAYHFGVGIPGWGWSGARGAWGEHLRALWLRSWRWGWWMRAQKDIIWGTRCGRAGQLWLWNPIFWTGLLGWHVPTVGMHRYWTAQVTRRVMLRLADWWKLLLLLL